MDGKVAKYIQRAKKIAHFEGLNTGKGSKYDPAVVIGIAAMLQLEEMSAPMIVVNQDGEAKKLDVRIEKDSDKN